MARTGKHRGRYDNDVDSAVGEAEYEGTHNPKHFAAHRAKGDAIVSQPRHGGTSQTATAFLAHHAEATKRYNREHFDMGHGDGYRN